MLVLVLVFVQAEDGIRDLVRSRGLGDVYKRQDDLADEVCEVDLSERQGAAFGACQGEE